MKITKLFTAIAVLSIAFSSCKKETATTKTSQNLYFHIQIHQSELGHVRRTTIACVFLTIIATSITIN
jgi:hypothetical protein